jgi:hypothetical protein
LNAKKERRAMSEESKKPMIYLGHPIRGKMKIYGGKTNDGVYDYENVNCAQAVENVNWLRKTYPEVRWYCPGEVETPVQMAHRMGMLTVPQILDMDFAIIRLLCSGGLLHIWEHSSGAEKEAERCLEWNYPHLVLREVPKEIWECDQGVIQLMVRQVLATYPSIEENRPTLDQVIEELKEKN